MTDTYREAYIAWLLDVPSGPQRRAAMEHLYKATGSPDDDAYDRSEFADILRQADRRMAGVVESAE